MFSKPLGPNHAQEGRQDQQGFQAAGDDRDAEVALGNAGSWAAKPDGFLFSSQGSVVFSAHDKRKSSTRMRQGPGGSIEEVRMACTQKLPGRHTHNSSSHYILLSGSHRLRSPRPEQLVQQLRTTCRYTRATAGPSTTRSWYRGSAASRHTSNASRSNGQRSSPCSLPWPGNVHTFQELGFAVPGHPGRSSQGRKPMERSAAGSTRCEEPWPVLDSPAQSGDLQPRRHGKHQHACLARTAGGRLLAIARVV